MKSRKMTVVTTSLLFAFLAAACSPATQPAPTAFLTSAPPTAEPTAVPTEPPTAAPPANPDLILATTTSTQDSGLLDVLIPIFEAQSGSTVKVVAVGTGQALQMGQDGNADVLLVHAPSSEKTFMEGGYGTDRFLVMHNDFVIVGPAADPAAIRGGSVAAEAFAKVAEAEAPFVSRGDNSGTHTKELALWKGAGQDFSATKPAWYVETGQGMGATLTIASEKAAYTLTDRATYLAARENLDLEVLVEKDNALLNVYHVITVNAAKWPKANYLGAASFAKWLIEPSTQDLIREFGVVEFGEPLFVPDGDKSDADFGL